MYALLVAVFIIFVTVVLQRRWTAARASAIPIEHRLTMVYERDNVRECGAVQVPCVTNKQCQDNCRLGLTFACRDGFCSPNFAQATFVGPEECDASRGMIMALVALDAFVVERVCISMYRDVIDDTSALRPYVCANGIMSVDLETRPFSVGDCECAPGDTRLTFSAGAYARDTPVCIPEMRAPLYSRVYTL